MEMRGKAIVADDNDSKARADIYLLNGYKVRIKYTDGNTFYHCMENAIKRLNGSFKYV